MKHFDSITNAIREIRDRTQEFTEEYDNVFLFIDYWHENFYVTEYEYDISEKLEQDYFENGCEPTPETLANECVVIEYSLATNKETYPSLYEKAKKPVFKSDVDLIRKRIDVEPEYSLDFNIG